MPETPLPSRKAISQYMSDDTMREYPAAASILRAFASGRLVDLKAIDIEAVAAVEHDQWVLWAKAVAHEVEPDRAARWRTFYVPYSELPEATKDSNRVWARRAVDAALGEV